MIGTDEPCEVADATNPPERALTRFASACIAGSLSRSDAKIGGAMKIDE
jgi:hypothetical protein